MFAGGEFGWWGRVGPAIGVRVEEVVGPWCGLAGLVPPAGVSAGGEDCEVALALRGWAWSCCELQLGRLDGLGRCHHRPSCALVT